ncbi:hypothetical protein BDF22DRAFT_740025 [Syncephalis plumigaleata]|nr:hypothetical protein BDF22DRAFT_740025 [Syncephalis plumigaleata]
MASRPQNSGKVTITPRTSRNKGPRIQSKISNRDLLFPNGWQEKERRRAVFKMPDPWWNQSRDAYQYSARMLLWLIVAVVFINSLLGKGRV